MVEVVVAARRRNILGEGPCWDARRGRLYWLDIQGRLLEWLSPADRRIGLWTLERRASAVAVRTDGTLLMATEDGLATFDPDAGGMTLRAEVEPDKPHNRSNDGNVDAQGRFWFGTMRDDAHTPEGAVYRLDPDWSVRQVVGELVIPNTLAASPDGRTLYVADSYLNVIWAFELDPETGAVGERRVFVETEDGCSPDGSAVDEEGCLWNAQWGGWKVVRYRPDGTVAQTVKMPVEQPSSCAFGDADLSTIYVTSAREGLSPEQLERQPLAGSLFSFRPGVRGMALPEFQG